MLNPQEVKPISKLTINYLDVLNYLNYLTIFNLCIMFSLKVKIAFISIKYNFS